MRLTIGEIAGGILLLAAFAALRPPPESADSAHDPDLCLAGTAAWVAPVNAAGRPQDPAGASTIGSRDESNGSWSSTGSA